MNYFQEMQDTFNAGDEEIRTWFLVQHNYLPLMICGFYALFSWVIGPAFMKNRKPFELRKPMIIFNFLVVATYVVSLGTIFWNLTKVTREVFCNGAETVRKGTTFYTLATHCWVIYILKYAEFFDTVFFVLRKKNNLITFLHVIHHTTVPLMGWVMLRSERSGFQAIPVLINGCVHVVMYTYYGLAAMGPQVRKYLWWKKYLTMLQMIQFSIILLFVTIIAPFSGCRMMKASFLIDIVFGSLFLYLFYIYYEQNYKRKKIN